MCSDEAEHGYNVHDYDDVNTLTASNPEQSQCYRLL
jgi:hypothetical protein